MAKGRVTKDEIYDVCNEFNKSNEEITTINVRYKLKKGSLNTVQKYVREWKKEQKFTFNISKHNNVDEFNGQVLTEKVKEKTGLFVNEIINLIKTNFEDPENYEDNYLLEIENAKKEVERKEKECDILQLDLRSAKADEDILRKIIEIIKLTNSVDISSNSLLDLDSKINQINKEYKKLKDSISHEKNRK